MTTPGTTVRSKDGKTVALKHRHSGACRRTEICNSRSYPVLEKRIRKAMLRHTDFLTWWKQNVA